jgi:alanyl-tRNA synthetase
MFTSSELRKKYLEFFVGKGHVVIPSASLVPANDPTVLFTTAGMHPLVPYLLGEPHAAGTRLVNAQRCVRTGDIDEIGDDTHLTFFEMLGNWSLGDYFREESIRWSFEFLTRVLGLPIERLGVTCFAGDDEVPRDDESVRIWRSLGIDRIRMLGRDDNWWGPAGPTGPCGPDTEIFVVDGERWIEIWNNVFMGYTKTASGTIEPLARHNVDTGMGLERTLMVLGGFSSVYEVDTIAPLYQQLRAMRDSPHELRVITDHLRAACAIIGDGVGPSNKDRGYVLRRLLRRCGLFAKRLDLPRDWFVPLVRSDVVDTIAHELERFEKTLVQGLKVIRKLPSLDGTVAFDLFQTYGFPVELTLEIAAQHGTPIDRDSIRRALDEHRARSRSVSFTGGLADHSEQVVRYHTLTHLLQASLRRVLGEHVIQRGSNITPERLRFDYSHDGKPSPDELARVEQLVNAWLARDLVVERHTMSEPEARALGAIGAFGEKYGDAVSVYSIRDVDTLEVISREFCGGPHVQAIKTQLRGHFAITREQSISTGVRRIKAVLT